MRTSTTPDALLVVVGVFIGSGVLAAVGMVSHLVHLQGVSIDWSVVNLWIGFWPCKREPRGLRWAVAMFAVAMTLIQLWQYCVLTHSDTRALFATAKALRVPAAKR